MTKKEKKLFKIYILGNPESDIDSLPLRIIPLLKRLFPDVQFLEIDPTENFPQENHLVIIDTVLNIKKVRILDDIDKIVFRQPSSLHDFDLGFQLKLMKKLHQIKKVTIIAIPAGISENKAVEESRKIISSLL